MLNREETFHVENVLELLYELLGMREWCPLYEAVMKLLIVSEGGFITIKTNEVKIKFWSLAPR